MLKKVMIGLILTTSLAFGSTYETATGTEVEINYNGDFVEVGTGNVTDEDVYDEEGFSADELEAQMEEIDNDENN